MDPDSSYVSELRCTKIVPEEKSEPRIVDDYEPKNISSNWNKDNGNSHLNNEKYKKQSIPNTDKDDEGFILVKRNKHKKKGIIGSKNVSPSNILKSALKKVNLYVGNCDISITPETLTSYIKDEICVNIFKIISLETKYDSYTSFKITVDINDRPKLLSPDVRPTGIVCRKFYNPKVSVNHG